jgi:hypothetical protein
MQQSDEFLTVQSIKGGGVLPATTPLENRRIGRDEGKSEEM